MRDALYLLIRFRASPTNAHILCVGAGTSELIYLAQKLQFHRHRCSMFVAREPKSGIARCTFHEGYLDSLPTSDFNGKFMMQLR